MTPAPRVDAHQHFWRYSAAEHPWIDDGMAALRRDFLPGDLLPELGASGIDRTIAVQVRQSLDETRWLLELAAEHPFVAGVVGWVDLQSGRVADDLAALATDRRLVGIRHVVQSEPDDNFMLRPDVCRGLRALGALDLAYDILIYPRHLPVAAELVSRFDGQRFVLDHAAKPDIRRGAIAEWARDLRRLAEAPNVSCKLSGLVTEADWDTWTPGALRPYLDVAFECFGPDRLIAGSDWPVCTLAAGYGRTMSVVNDYLAPRPAAERDAVLGGNAMRVWRLPAHAAPEPRTGLRRPAEHTQ
jgi:L-fuconolactonase